MVDFQDHANAESWRMRHKCPVSPKHTHEKGVCLIFVSVSDTLGFFPSTERLVTNNSTLIQLSSWQIYEMLLLS